MDIKQYEKQIRSKCVNGIYRGWIDLYSLDLIVLPDLSDIIIRSDFDCGSNPLKSLKGAPKSIGGFFDCCDCDLISLDGLPEHIEGNFYIDKQVWDKLPKDTNEAMYLILNNKLRLV